MGAASVGALESIPGALSTVVAASGVAEVLSALTLPSDGGVPASEPGALVPLPLHPMKSAGVMTNPANRARDKSLSRAEPTLKKCMRRVCSTDVDQVCAD